MSLHHAVRTAPRFAPTPLSWSLHLAFAALAAAAMVGPVRANPVGGVVVGGQASIAQPSPALTQINQSSQRAVIDWRSFSIGAGEAVRFNQPSASAATLNRVIGNDPSSILGSLSANGRVYLVNQNGVFIGRDAQVDAAALVLSTANISNSDFMAGRLNFNQPGKPGARIVNEGRITAADGGLVAMVAPGVENRGVISAKLGQVILAGAPAFSLDLFGDGLVNIVLNQAGMGQIADATGKPLANYVDNSGRVVAEGGRIWISAATARGLVDGMVNISGELRATRVAQQGGEITLLGGDRLNVSGSVVATSADGKGGSIGADANKIVLASNAVLDASGATGGGSVLVGGGYQGKSRVPGASATAGSLHVAKGANIKADTTGAVGNGGMVVLWSENDTRFAGSVSARAGARGGDGGLMEVSGKKHLAFDGQADASAPNGVVGSLLLDPGSLTIADTGGTGTTATGADSVVAASSINGMLRAGTASVILQADDNITVNAVIDGRPLAGSTTGAAGVGLTLSAGDSVFVNKSIVLNGGAFTSDSKRGSFTQAPQAVIASLSSDTKLASAPFTIAAVGNITTNYLLTSGDMTLRSAGGNVTAEQPFGGEFAGSVQPVGHVTVSAPGGQASVAAGLRAAGPVDIDASSVILGNVAAGGAIDAKANSIRTLGGTSVYSAAGSLAFTAGSGGIDAAGMLAANDPLALTSAATPGRITLDSQGNISLAQLVATGQVDIASHGGSVNLRESIGGKDPDHPSIGALAVTAWNDIVTNGLNLAGGAGTGLSLDAGARGRGGARTVNPAGGHIVVNDRIGVSRGDLLFGAGAATSDSKYSATLFQGVYARTGIQSITFNVPVVADGSKILADWKRLFPNGFTTTTRTEILSDALNASLNDMVLIPIFRDGGGNPLPQNALAQALVERGGGLRVSFIAPVGTTRGRIERACAADLNVACGSAPDFWMIPKIVISNQENPGSTDNKSITLAGGTSLAPSALAPASPSAGLKLIVPASGDEKRGTPNNGDFLRFQLVDRTQLQADDIVGCTAGDTLCTASYFTDAKKLELLNMNYAATPFALYAEIDAGGAQPSSRSEFLGVRYFNGIVDVLDAASPKTSSDPIPVSVTVFPGQLGNQFQNLQADGNSVVPSGFTGYNSNSNPGAFASVGVNVNLSQQIAAALPGRPTDGGSGGGGGSSLAIVGPATDSNVVAAAQTLERRANAAQEDAPCAGPDRLVVGRTAGDEADVGATTALRGAPRPVFKTSFTLGTVSPELPNADVQAIAGAQAGTACR